MTPIEQSLSLSTISTIILAGGRSSRMGQDKALIPINGIPLLQRVGRVAQQCSDSIYVVTPWIKRYESILSSIPVQFVSETSDERSPLTGFLQGLEQVKSDWVLLLACDLPNLNAEVLQQWSADLPPLPDIACLSKNPNGWWEPLCGFYRTDCRLRLQEYASQGGRSFQRWLDQESVRELHLSDPRMLLNCNTPEDLEVFLSQGGE